MKKKQVKFKSEDEVYSFKAPSSEGSQQQILSLASSRHSFQRQPALYGQPLLYPQRSLGASTSTFNKIKAGIYRHKQNQLHLKKQQIQGQTNSNRFDLQCQVHPRIQDISLEIENNLKRRIQLEQALDRLKQQEKNQYVRKAFEKQSFGTLKTSETLKNQFVNRNQKSSFLDRKTSPKRRKKQEIDENIEILTGNNMNCYLQNLQQQNIANSQKKKGFTLQDFVTWQEQQQKSKISQKSQKNRHTQKPKHKQIQLSIEPNLIKIQQLLSQLTFPQVPKTNLASLQKKCLSAYALHKSHSDLVYAMIVICFHLGKFDQVRTYFKQILMFKKFQSKSFWVAAETQFILQSYQACIKLTETCINVIDDKFFPRFLYLKAKSYSQLGNFTNSIVCYNQLIRIKPKIAEYYLERAILHDKLGYTKECQQDYLLFGIMKPQAKQYMQERIMTQENQGKRKELMQIYAKIV